MAIMQDLCTLHLMHLFPAEFVADLCILCRITTDFMQILHTFSTGCVQVVCIFLYILCSSCALYACLMQVFLMQLLQMLVVQNHCRPPKLYAELLKSLYAHLRVFVCRVCAD